MDFEGISERPDDIVALSDELLSASQRERFPYETVVLGVPIVVHADVFSPKYVIGAEPFARTLGPLVRGLDVLEVGPGTGAIAVHLARAGAGRVVAIDINPAAVANTRENAERLGLADRVDAREGDVFGALRPDERFGLIFWNVPFGYVDPGFPVTPLQRSTLDPGYGATRRYVLEGRRWLAPGGRLLMGFSSVIGRLGLVREMARGAGLEVRLAGTAPPPPESPLLLEMYEVLPAAGEGRPMDGG